ncbi:hypothetical protein [Paenibacillus lignilyticus]|uniref:Uncharacterized protein n=1 Tax=Paenibacillus lignilyticus TaxID=1172615 RepID=A0ABS5CG32_9BACL|nr:hypothetical protein [Paenibacillus lignilyticus]MBP3964828.1 hypothetical protein [Paenibacillus lignilyticus]
MKRWKKVTLWIASIVVVLGIAGVFTANYAVNKVIGSLSASLEPDLTIDTSDETIIVDPKSNNVTDNEQQQVNTNNNVPPKKETTKGSSDTTDTQDTVNQEVNPTSSNEKTNTSVERINEYSSEVSVEKAKNIKESVSIKDKASVTSILLSKLSLKDMKKLQQLASGGLSIEEKREARKIVLNEVSPEQYNELSQIAKKYGVSQGKTHDEVVKEETLNN